MRGLHSYVVEVNQQFYADIESESGKIITGDRGGHLGQTLPQHGTVIATIPGSVVNVGDTLFYVHFDLYEAVDVEGRMLIQVREEHLLGYSKNFPRNYNVEQIKKSVIHPLGCVIGKKISNPAYKNTNDVVSYNQPEWLPQQYKIISPIPKLGIKKGHMVTVYLGSDYMLPYLPDRAFLYPEFITFNMSSMTSVGDYILVEMKQLGISHVNGVAIEDKPTVPNALGTISTNKGRLKKGDTIRFHWRKAQQSPIHPNLCNPLYSQVMTQLQ